MSQSLVRKQFLVSPSHVTKLERLAEAQGTSATEIVRLAIDAFDPEDIDAMASDDLMALVSDQLKSAIASTQNANAKVAETLKVIESRKH